MKNLDEKSQVLECHLLLIIFVITLYGHRIQNRMQWIRM